MPKIVIGEVTIDFPNTGADPTWSPSIIQFAQAVEKQLSTISSNYDVQPSVLPLNENANVGLELPECAFNKTHVRSFTFSYAIYREVDTTTIPSTIVSSLTEAGTVVGVHNGSSWSLEHSYQGERQENGASYHTFTIDSQDQLKLTTVALPVVSGQIYNGNTNSKISYSAKALLTGENNG